MNTFTDFIAGAGAPDRQGYSSADRLVARGGSAGGLLMGAITNLRPDLFAAIVAEVPFVDVVTTMLDPSLPAHRHRVGGVGRPAEPDAYARMKSYSPYDNVRAADYPALLVTTGLNDPRWQYWEPAKWVAKAAHLSTSGKLIVLRTEMGAGHGGPVGPLRRLARRSHRPRVRLRHSGRRERRRPHGAHGETADGLTLESEWTAPADALGDRSAVSSASAVRRDDAQHRDLRLFEALPAHGIACLRFNFRGVEDSEGAHNRRPRRAPRRRGRARLGGDGGDPRDRRPARAHRLVVRRRHRARHRRPPSPRVGSAIAPPLRFRPERLRRRSDTTRARSCSSSPSTTSSARPTRSQAETARLDLGADRDRCGREPLLRGPHRSRRHARRRLRDGWRRSRWGPLGAEDVGRQAGSVVREGRRLSIAMCHTARSDSNDARSPSSYACSSSSNAASSASEEASIAAEEMVVDCADAPGRTPLPNPPRLQLGSEVRPWAPPAHVPGPSPSTW